MTHLLSVADHCLRGRGYLNRMVIDKQSQLQWLNIEDAIAHCARGLSTWRQWARHDHMVEPDVVLACAGDSPALETVAVAWWLRQHLPDKTPGTS